MSTPDRDDTGLWRVFPWDPSARDGARFSPAHVPRPTGRGRFDLPRTLSSVLYLAGSPEHAVAEMIHPWRGSRIGPAHLRRASFALALVPVRVEASAAETADLCDPRVLARVGVPPDRSASRLRTITQPLARRVWDGGFAGLRWWSSFWGDWHTTVLFTERTGDCVAFGEPETIGIEHPALLRASELLGIEVVA